jgi:uncharacterized membrane protein
MDLRIITALILSILPVSELRGAMIYAIASGLNNSISIYLIFLLTTLANILVIFFIFFFLDFLHKHFMKIAVYRRFFEHYIGRLQSKVNKFENKYRNLGFLALVIFVGIPLPGTGAWTGAVISWILNLNRKKSIIAIAFGVLIAGILVLLASLGIISVFS